MLTLLLTLMACGDDATESTPSTTTAEPSPLIWEVHEVACEADRYIVPGPRVGLASYTVMEHLTNSQGEDYANARIEQVPSLRTDADTWEFTCYPDGYLLVVTYAYVAE